MPDTPFLVLTRVAFHVSNPSHTFMLHPFQSASVVILSHVHTQFIPTRDCPFTILACAPAGSLIGQQTTSRRERPFVEPFL